MGQEENKIYVIAKETPIQGIAEVTMSEESKYPLPFVYQYQGTESFNSIVNEFKSLALSNDFDALGLFAFDLDKFKEKLVTWEVLFSGDGVNFILGNQKLYEHFAEDFGLEMGIKKLKNYQRISKAFTDYLNRNVGDFSDEVTEAIIKIITTGTK